MSQIKPSQKPKIVFHETHGNDIMVSHEYTTARRTETNDNGLVFTSEPIKPLQKITIKLLDVSDKSTGIISVGFTSHDPSTLRYDLPKSTRSELKKRQGFWICSLSKQHCIRSGILFFYVSVSGKIHFGVNGEEKGCFEKKVDTDEKLWGLIDIWSPQTAIQVYNSHKHPLKSSIFHEFANNNVETSGNRVQNFQIKPSQKAKILFHETHGNDIMVSHEYTTARRTETNDNGLVFTSECIKPLQKIKIKLLDVSEKSTGIISVGFTSHDPSTLRYDLPKSTRSELKKRQGFWICSLSKQHCIRSGILFFYVSESGKIHFGVNGEEKGCFEKKVDTNEELWALIEIWSPQTAIQVYNSHNHPLKSTIFHEFADNNVKINGNRVQKYDNNPSYVFIGRNLQLEKSIQVRFLSDGNLALGVTSCNPTLLTHSQLPENPDSLLDRPEYWVVVEDSTWDFKRNDELTYLISSNGEMKIWKNSALLLKKFYVDQTAKLWGFFVLGTAEKIEVMVLEESLVPSVQKTEKQVQGESNCVICYDALAEAVLYPCGHMCMCSECAKKQWRGDGDGHCPLCRVGIKDVMKIYKS